MSPSERSPLLDGHPNGHSGSRISSFFKAEGEPTWVGSLRFLFFSSYFNLFLVFVPLSVISHHLNWDAGLRFAFSFLAIVPLAKLLGESTEQLSMKLGETLGGLLNASFGNAVEIIVGVAALVQGELRIVQTSMLGSILSNLLLVLGMSFVSGQAYKPENVFQETAAQTSSSLMTLACFTLVIPAAYHSAKEANHPPFNKHVDDALSILSNLNSTKGDGGPPAPGGQSEPGLLVISRFTSILLLLVYTAYLYFQLGSHADLFTKKKVDEHGEPIEEEEEEPSMSMVSAAISLLAITVVTSFCADYLVASIEETAEKYHIPKPFIGVVLIPLVSNAAEHVTAVWMAAKGKMDLTIGIAVGSSIQIAVFVIPLLVLVGWGIHQPLTLYFSDFETVSLFVSVLLVNLLVQDGKSNYMEGIMLITLYLVIGAAFWVS
ncbi:hypothetical protein M407DRAFT_89616 [Tulasnella calospora MUT 4182]|uniref:Vacuolar calcium ion transporter n=1 Tax=Tulasnella calospora MUT 4182 TaxID=1051891 RepID=A0A0C3QZ89_9AGAM|nr:hypothetical protein M407DRAFT_89616 [Tulasnella calospora MUT 4182]